VIVDRQQRLTSLYAVIKGVAVVRENFATERIEIAFNPPEGRFEVPDAAIRRDRRFIPSISAIWDPKTDLIQFASDYVESLKAALEQFPSGVNRGGFPTAGGSDSRCVLGGEASMHGEIPV